ncbi:MAG TPA: antifreeze protein, partial [Rhodospirillaceae bacterium]|nr:antifreeze protein [Rhodospirillaceae bacterium]
SFGSAARLFGPEILSIAPTPDLTWFAYPAARALFAAQRSDAALQWLGLARAQGLTDQAAAATAMALAPLARLSRQDEQPLAALLAGWRKTRAALPAADIGQRRDVVLLCLLAAQGERVPSEEWLGLLDNQNGAGGLSRPVLSQLLRLATEEARLGETVAFALAGFGDLSKADPILLYQGLVGLRRLGLEADARAIAIEAALANGI